MAVNYGDFGTLDFIQYWSSFHLLQSGQNPYAYPLLESLQRGMGNSGDIILMWNPPWLLLIFYPILMLPFGEAARVWLYADLIALVGIVVTLNDIYKPKRELLLLALISVLAFSPLWYSLLYGQVTVFLTLFFCLSLLFLKRNRPLWAGAVFSLLSLKPHIFITIFILFSVWSFKRSGLKFIIGALSGFLLLSVATYLYQPTLIVDWIACFGTRAQVPGADLSYIWFTSTLIGFLRSVFSITGETLSIVIVGVTALFAFIMGRLKSHQPIETLILGIIPLSLLSAPYGWFFDYLILLPLPVAAISQLETFNRRAIFLTGLFFAVSLLAQPAIFHRFEQLIWFPAILGTLTIYLKMVSVPSLGDAG